MALFSDWLIFGCLGWESFLLSAFKAFFFAPITRACSAVRGGGGGFPGIIRHIPAAPFELDGWRRHESLKLASTFLTLGQWRIGELLDSLDSLSTLRTRVFVKRQLNLLAKPLLSIIGMRVPGVKTCQLSVVASFGQHLRPSPHVIPAKAGIHSASLPEFAAYRLDSRFRGNDV